MKQRFIAIPFALLLAACSEEVGKPSSSGTPTDTEPGYSLEVTVPESGRVFVSFKEPSIVVPSGDPSADLGWDLAFEGYDILTNSGVSGSGDGGAFGPLDAITYEEGVAPTVPFMMTDETGGPFRDFWAYDPATHVLWVRYHVFGVREGEKLWKVQVLAYYAEQQGAPVSAMYRLRWASVDSSGVGMTQELADLDGTAGGSQPSDDTPSECLDLESGARVMHTPEQARNTKDWHLCFRRAAISVNGELGGPRGITAVDLHASETSTETLEALKERTAESELARFDAIGYAELAASQLIWRGDRVFSAFSDVWVKPGSSPKTPAEYSWLGTSADGLSRYLLIFDGLEGSTEKSPGKVLMRIRPEGL